MRRSRDVQRLWNALRARGHAPFTPATSPLAVQRRANIAGYVQGLPFVSEPRRTTTGASTSAGTFRTTADPATCLAVDAGCQTANVAEAGVKGACPLGRRPFQII